MLSLLLRRLFMSLLASRKCPNGVRTYAGRYHDGLAVYFYNENDGNRIYTGRFWFSRRYYAMPLGRSSDTAYGCFADGIKTGVWKFCHRVRGGSQKLCVSYADGRHYGTYAYRAVYKSRAFGFRNGVTTLVAELDGNKVVGRIECCINGEVLTGGYDEDGRTDGIWKLDSAKTEKCVTHYEVWEHGVCRESYAIDESTGDRIMSKVRMTDMLSSLVRRECIPLEGIVGKGSDVWQGAAFI